MAIEDEKLQKDEELSEKVQEEQLSDDDLEDVSGGANSEGRRKLLAEFMKSKSSKN